MSAHADRCVACVVETIQKHALIEKSETVLAAVSGGADSVCLLYVLHEAGYRVEVAHFDHQTRGGASGEDAAFVRDLAERLSFPFHTERRAVAAEAEGSALSFEKYARQVRYDFLLRTARAAGCVVIATGHHAGDQAETILMRILRGTTPHGLGGIPPQRIANGIRIVRPLIECTREDILAFLEARGLAYCTDHTNADTRYFRNGVRRDLLPLLAREYNPKVCEALLRLAEAQRCDTDLLDALADEALRGCVVEDRIIDRERFAQLHRAIQTRCMLKLAWRIASLGTPSTSSAEASIDLSFERVHAAADFIASAPVGHLFDLGGGVQLSNGRETTEMLVTRPVVDNSEVALAVPGATAAFGRTFAVRYHDVCPTKDVARYCTLTRQVFDAETIGRGLIVRHRRPGDRITPFGMSGSKKLQDYFVDIGLPASQRDAQLLVVAGGRIAWIVGHVIDAHGAVTPDTGPVIEIEVTDAP